MSALCVSLLLLHAFGCPPCSLSTVSKTFVQKTDVRQNLLERPNACAQASFVFSRQIHHLNPAMLRAGGFGVITVCRPLEKASLLKELSPSFRNIAILVEDSTILSAEMERTSSNMVRVWRRRAYAERNACSRVHYSAEPCACGGMNELVAVIGSLAYQRC